MFSNLKNKKRLASQKISTVCTLLLPSQNVVDGVLSRGSSFQSVDFAAAENQFKASDFSIGNLLAIGSYDILKKSCRVNVSRMKAADSFDNFNFDQNVPPQS